MKHVGVREIWIFESAHLIIAIRFHLNTKAIWSLANYLSYFKVNVAIRWSYKCLDQIDVIDFFEVIWQLVGLPIFT